MAVLNSNPNPSVFWQNANKFPSLRPRTWTTFLNFHSIGFRGLTFFIVNNAHSPIPDVLSIQRMLNLSLHFHAQRLGRFRARDDSNESLFQGSTLYSARREVRWSYWPQA
jgi:hypothetical protein